MDGVVPPAETARRMKYSPPFACHFYILWWSLSLQLWQTVKSKEAVSLLLEERICEAGGRHKLGLTLSHPSYTMADYSRRNSIPLPEWLFMYSQPSMRPRHGTTLQAVTTVVVSFCLETPWFLEALLFSAGYCLWNGKRGKHNVHPSSPCRKPQSSKQSHTGIQDTVKLNCGFLLVSYRTSGGVLEKLNIKWFIVSFSYLMMLGWRWCYMTLSKKLLTVAVDRTQYLFLFYRDQWKKQELPFLWSWNNCEYYLLYIKLRDALKKPQRQYFQEHFKKCYSSQCGMQLSFKSMFLQLFNLNYYIFEHIFPIQSGDYHKFKYVKRYFWVIHQFLKHLLSPV